MEHKLLVLGLVLGILAWLLIKSRRMAHLPVVGLAGLLCVLVPHPADCAFFGFTSAVSMHIIFAKQFALRILYLAFGFIMISLAILLKALGLGLPTDAYGMVPYSHGLWKNLRVAVGRYSYSNLMRRFFFIWKMPHLSMQYFSLLSNKEKLHSHSWRWVDPVTLQPAHDVYTQHEHHRKRVRAFSENRPFSEELSPNEPIVIVRGKIRDGHHRIAAAREASVPKIKVLWWE